MSWALGPIWQPPKEKIGHPALILLSTSDFTENVGMFQGSSIVDGLTVQTGTRHDINQKSKFETLYILLSFNLLPWHYYTDHRCRSLNFNQWQVILFLGKSNVTVERTWLFFFVCFLVQETRLEMVQRMLALQRLDVSCYLVSREPIVTIVRSDPRWSRQCRRESHARICTLSGSNMDGQPSAYQCHCKHQIFDALLTELIYRITRIIQTTFFVATEAGLLAVTVPSRSDTLGLSTLGKLSNVGFMSALVVHIFAGKIFLCHSFLPYRWHELFLFSSAAIISFLAAFFLVRYRLTVAEKEEAEAEKNLVDSPKSMSLNHLEKSRAWTSHTDDIHTDSRVGRRVRVSSALSGDQIIWSTDPHLVQVGPFQRQPPTELVARCYSLCLFLSFVGFILALIGAISFAWDRLPWSISIFISILTVLCLVAAILILVFPSTKTSHIYYHPKSRRR